MTSPDDKKKDAPAAGPQGPPERQDACWRTCGVFSYDEAVCPDLEQVVHCRNCDVFTRAGRALLERPLTDEGRREWADLVAVKKEEERPGALAVLIFRVAGEWLALRAELLSGVIKPERYHRIPHRNHPVLLGMINVHGELYLCVSLFRLLGLSPAPDSGSSRRIYRRMIVLRHEENHWVFPADEIQGVYRVPLEDLEAPPATVIRSAATYTRRLFALGDKRVALLDDELLLLSFARSVQ
ncbi:MAG: chemotaxis protein CheW [Desulfobacterales bacterium]|nr:MAG: chemotaxis protein CheW [Desulfobacterales bacterium]